MSGAKKRDSATYAWLWAMMADVGLSSSAKSAGTVLALKFKHNTTGLCNPGYDAIAEAMGRTRRPAITAVAELRSRGWLIWSGTAGGSQANTNQFSFVMRSDNEAEPVLSAAPVSSTAPVLNTVATGAVNGKRPVLYTAHELSSELSRNYERETRRARADFLPDDFKVSDETYGWALNRLGSNRAVDHSLDRFRNHFRSVNGHKAKSRNWDARLRNWIDDDAQQPADTTLAPGREAAGVITDDQWGSVLSAFVKFGRWTRHVDQFGPAPNEAGCRAPKYLLSKHGIAIEVAA